jgi:hypothetical protein
MIVYQVTAEVCVEGGTWRPYRAQVRADRNTRPRPRSVHAAIRRDVAVADGILPRSVLLRRVHVTALDGISLVPCLEAQRNATAR